MTGAKIGKYEIVDHNHNDRFDYLFDEVKAECGLPGGCWADGERFRDEMHDYGMDVFKLSTYSLAKTSEAARLMDEAAQRPMQAKVALLRGKAQAAGLDEGKYLDRLWQALSRAHRTAMDKADAYSIVGMPGEVSVALDQAKVCAEKAIELGLKLAVSEDVSKELLGKAQANDIEKRLGQLEAAAIRGDYNESDFRVHLAVLHDYELEGKLPSGAADLIRERIHLLYDYVYCADRPLLFMQRQLLGKYIKVRSVLRSVIDFENARELLAEADEVTASLRRFNYRWSNSNVVTAHPDGADLAGPVMRRILEEHFLQIEADSFFWREGIIQSRLDELEVQASEAGLEFDEERAERCLVETRVFHLRSIFWEAEAAARRKDAERTHEKLHEAWEYASEINVDFNTVREAEILNLLQNGEGPEDEQVIRSIGYYWDYRIWNNMGNMGQYTHQPGFHGGIGLFLNK